MVHHALQYNKGCKNVPVSATAIIFPIFLARPPRMATALHSILYIRCIHLKSSHCPSSPPNIRLFPVLVSQGCNSWDGKIAKPRPRGTSRYQPEKQIVGGVSAAMMLKFLAIMATVFGGTVQYSKLLHLQLRSQRLLSKRVPREMF